MQPWINRALRISAVKAKWGCISHDSCAPCTPPVGLRLAQADSCISMRIVELGERVKVRGEEGERTATLIFCAAGSAKKGTKRCRGGVRDWAPLLCTPASWKAAANLPQTRPITSRTQEPLSLRRRMGERWGGGQESFQKKKGERFKSIGPKLFEPSALWRMSPPNFPCKWLRESSSYLFSCGSIWHTYRVNLVPKVMNKTRSASYIELKSKNKLTVNMKLKLHRLLGLYCS